MKRICTYALVVYCTWCTCVANYVVMMASFVMAVQVLHDLDKNLICTMIYSFCALVWSQNFISHGRTIHGAAIGFGGTTGQGEPINGKRQEGGIYIIDLWIYIHIPSNPLSTSLWWLLVHMSGLYPFAGLYPYVVRPSRWHASRSWYLTRQIGNMFGA